MNTEEVLLKMIDEALVLDKTKEVIDADINGLLKVVKLSEVNDAPIVFVISNKWIGAYYLKKAEYSKALNYYQIALNKVNLHSNFSKEKFIIKTGIANSYLKMRRFKDSEKINLDLLKDLNSKSSNKEKDSLHLINSKKTILQNLGNVYLQQGKFNKAIPIIKEAAGLIKRSQYLSNELFNAAKVSSVFNLGSAYLLSGNAKLAKPYILKNLNFIKGQNKNLKTLAQCYGNLAYCEFLLKDYNSAYDYYFKSLKISKTNNYSDVTLITYKDLSDTYRKDKKWTKSINYLNKYYSLKDSIQGITVQRNFDKIRIEFETEQKEQEIIKLNQEKLLARQEKKILLIALFIAFLIVLFFMFIYINIKGNRKKETELKSLKIINLSQEIKYKKRDITRLALEISKKQELAKELSSHIKKLDVHIPLEIKTKWRKVGTIIQGHLQSSDEQKVFYENVDDINNAFYGKLEKHFSNLSKSERELCSFIRLGLSNKEISALRNVSLEAVRSSRFRLRKKLNFTSKDEVEVFLQKL
ncbi:tetratricopeptide repeat protein [uncultured Tenacibaculum sp.]|uniref:tetratricopeptide repeat protein n=1 Tax=uncultured Tenacibaculum sp. TaxID=174713 RepID=UPI00261C0959|nr:tetratricopeptide repeat protein [uncultured Tenacibaculum sp.]